MTGQNFLRPEELCWNEIMSVRYNLYRKINLHNHKNSALNVKQYIIHVATVQSSTNF